LLNLPVGKTKKKTGLKGTFSQTRTYLDRPAGKEGTSHYDEKKNPTPENENPNEG